MGMCMELVAHNLRASSRASEHAPLQNILTGSEGVQWHIYANTRLHHQMHKFSKNNSLTII